MNMKLSVFCVSLLLVATLSRAQAELSNYKTAINKFKEFYNANHPDSLFNLFSPQVKAGLPLEVTKTMFTQMHAQLGNLKQTTFTKYNATAGVYKTDYEKSTMMLSLSLNGLNQIDGIYFNEYKADAAAKPADKPAPATVAKPTVIATVAATPITDPSLIETPFVLKTLGGTLSGTLTTPKDFTGKIPVVIIIAGGGPIDRDGNSATGVHSNTYKYIAEALGKANIACLRYDKRGVGQSTSSGKETDSKFTDLIYDASGLIVKLKEDPRFSKFIILGHSDGALVGMLTAYSEPVAGLISAEGPGETADKIILAQMKTTKPPAVVQEFQTIVDSMKKGKTVPKVDPALYNIARPSLQNYLMTWIYFDPARVIHKVKIPILIIQGTTDLQVSVTEAENLKKGRSEATLKIIDGMNHILKAAPADPEKNTATYSDPDLPLKPEFVTAMLDFIKGLK